jgi:hypothetical protein
MTYLAGLVVATKKQAELVAAVKKAYASIGAVESKGEGAMRVVIGAPKKGWSVITDGTRQTIDLGVAAALADELGTRVLAFGLRGGGSHGKGASKAFGTWAKKPPSSGKPKAIRDAIDKLGKDLIPMPWEVDERDGVTLWFDVRKATLAPGPFKSNTPDDLREAEQGAQKETTWHIESASLNGRLLDDEVMTYLPGLRDQWGWQDAANHTMHLLQTNSLKLDRNSARLFIMLVDRALEGITAKTIAQKWIGREVDAAVWTMIRQALPLLCALVAEDTAAWDRFLAKIDVDREPYGIYVWTKSPGKIAKLSKTSRALLERDFPAKRLLAWAAKAPLDPNTRWLRDAAMLAAIEGDSAVLDRAFADPTDSFLAPSLHTVARTLVSAKLFAPALVLFDRLIASSPKDLSVYTNALYAVQHDNNGLPLDRERAKRYVAAATPHAEAETAIYVNLACVHLELGDRVAMQAALDAMKRHKMRYELKELLAQPMFVKAKIK